MRRVRRAHPTNAGFYRETATVTRLCVTPFLQPGGVCPHRKTCPSRQAHRPPTRIPAFTSASTRTPHGHRQPASRVYSRPDRLHYLGPVPALLQGDRAGTGTGDHRPPGALVGLVRRPVAAGLETPRLAARAARQSMAPGRTGCQRPADRQQLAGLCVGGQQRTHARSQPGLLHQPAGECAARHADSRRAPASPAVAGRGPGRPRRGAAGVATGQPALGVPGAGPHLRLLRPDPQAGAGRRPARPGGGNLAAATPGPGLVAAASGGTEYPGRVLEHAPGALADRCWPHHPGAAGVLQRGGTPSALHHPGFPAVPGADPGAVAGDLPVRRAL